MNARGSTEVIVATIGLSMGALSQNLFTMIVAMAVITTMAMPPMLRWGLVARADHARRRRSGSSARSSRRTAFVPNLERLLLAVDDSPNGKFASRLAGLIAGRRGMPTTVLPLDIGQGLSKPNAKKPDAESRQYGRAGQGRRRRNQPAG